MGFLSQLRYRLQRFMYGRNGVDLLSRDLNIAGLVFMIANLFFHTYILYAIGFVCFCVSLFRSLSRNVAKRSKENVMYFNARNKVKNWFAAKKREFSDRKVYRYYTCSTCKQRLRVPKGKGKIEITCPRCKNHFIKKT